MAARCKHCNFNLDHRSHLAGVSDGHCDGCNRRVCFQCGCTEITPCVREGLPCSWFVFATGATPEGAVGFAVTELPSGICNFCFYDFAAAMYADATARDEESKVIVFE